MRHQHYYTVSCSYELTQRQASQVYIAVTTLGKYDKIKHLSNRYAPDKITAALEMLGLSQEKYHYDIGFNDFSGYMITTPSLQDGIAFVAALEKFIHENLNRCVLSNRHRLLHNSNTSEQPILFKKEQWQLHLRPADAKILYILAEKDIQKAEALLNIHDKQIIREFNKLSNKAFKPEKLMFALNTLGLNATNIVSLAEKPTLSPELCGGYMLQFENKKDLDAMLNTLEQITDEQLNHPQIQIASHIKPIDSLNNTHNYDADDELNIIENTSTSVNPQLSTNEFSATDNFHMVHHEEVSNSPHPTLMLTWEPEATTQQSNKHAEDEWIHIGSDHQSNTSDSGDEWESIPSMNH